MLTNCIKRLIVLLIIFIYYYQIKTMIFLFHSSYFFLFILDLCLRLRYILIILDSKDKTTNNYIFGRSILIFALKNVYQRNTMLFLLFYIYYCLIKYNIQQ